MYVSREIALPLPHVSLGAGARDYAIATLGNAAKSTNPIRQSDNLG